MATHKEPLYQAIAATLVAIENCRKTGNPWLARHVETIERLCREHMPSGSGFDNGTKLDLDRSKPDRLVFVTSYHHMSEYGSYCGWSEHTVFVKANLAFGFIMRIVAHDTGIRVDEGWRDYAYDVFDHALRVQINPFA